MQIPIKIESDQESVSGSISEQPVMIPASNIMDPRGDLILIAGPYGEAFPEPVPFRVCSRSLARSSAVLDAWLFEDNKLSGDGWTLTCQDVHPEALRIILKLLHGRLNDLPATLDVQLLAELVILCNRYGILELSRSYCDTWIKHIRAQKTIPKRLLPAVLHIFWILGDQAEFNRALRVLVLNLNPSLDLSLIANNRNLQALGIAGKRLLSSMRFPDTNPLVIRSCSASTRLGLDNDPQVTQHGNRGLIKTRCTTLQGWPTTLFEVAKAL